jgi:hypothetical protein
VFGGAVGSSLTHSKLRSMEAEAQAHPVSETRTPLPAHNRRGEYDV